MPNKKKRSSKIQTSLENLPTSPGVYWFLDKDNVVIYIGKAINLKRRVTSYFNPNNTYIQNSKPKMVQSIFTILYEQTKSDFEAIILESQKIKLFRPKYNLQQKDDRSYLYIEIPLNEFPKIALVRQTHLSSKRRKRTKTKTTILGPFTHSQAIRDVLRILRPSLPFKTCSNPYSTPCWHSRMGLCPAHSDSLGAHNNSRLKQSRHYHEDLSTLTSILTKNSRELITELVRRTEKLASRKKFEDAAVIRDQVRSIEYITSKTFISRSSQMPTSPKNLIYSRGVDLLKLFSEYPKKISRIEGYDISNIQGTSPTGSMVVFSHEGPSKKDYRLFHIKSLSTPNDVGMMREMLSRRLSNKHLTTSSSQYWRLPNVMIIDGGVTQFSTAQSVLAKRLEQKGPNTFTHRKNNGTLHTLMLYSLAKRYELVYTDKTKLPTPLSSFPQETQQLFRAVRDESHRFALKGHRSLRGKRSSKLQS